MYLLYYQSIYLFSFHRTLFLSFYDYLFALLCASACRLGTITGTFFIIIISYKAESKECVRAVFWHPLLYPFCLIAHKTYYTAPAAAAT